MNNLYKIGKSFIIIFFSMAVSSNAFSERILEGLSFDSVSPLIYKSRIYLIPEDKQAIASDMLGKNKFKEVEKLSLRKLYPSKKFDTNEMLKQQIDSSLEYAEKCDKIANLPMFKEKRESLLHEAEMHKAYANYTKSISSVDLKPYLIRTVVFNRKTGAYRINLNGNSLVVRHGSLGTTTSTAKPLIILVFTERTINDVEVYSNIAQ